MKILELIIFGGIALITVAGGLFVAVSLCKYIYDEIYSPIAVQKPKEVYVVVQVKHSEEEPIITVFDNLSSAAVMKSVVEKSSDDRLTIIDVAPINHKYVTYKTHWGGQNEESKI